MQKIQQKNNYQEFSKTKKKTQENGHKKFELKVTVKFFPSKSDSKIVINNLH